MKQNFSSKGDDYSVNHQIRSYKIRVIKDGEQIGVMDKSKAIDYARSFNLDLIEIAKQDNISICIVTDYGKYKYEQNLKEKLKRKSQVVVGEKELLFSPTIEQHDLNVQVNKLKEFLSKGFNVRLTVRIKSGKPRQLDRSKWIDVLNGVLTAVSDISSIISPPVFSNRSLIAKVSPKKEGE